MSSIIFLWEEIVVIKKSSLPITINIHKGFRSTCQGKVRAQHPITGTKVMPRRKVKCVRFVDVANVRL